MDCLVYEITHERYFCRIEETGIPKLGGLIYIYINGEQKYDYYQESIEMCMEFVNQRYGIPMDKWVCLGSAPEGYDVFEKELGRYI